MARRKQETRALAVNGKGSWKLHLLFNFKVERGQGLRDWQRTSQSQEGRESWKRETQKTESETTEIRRDRDTQRQAVSRDLRGNITDIQRKRQGQ